MLKESRRTKRKAFTLSELLIALAILGVIATFTIPKILQAQQDQQFNASVKEAIGMVSAAYEVYKTKNPITAGTKMADLTPYMNYVAVDTTTVIDNNYGVPWVSSPCGTYDCLRLHSGAILLYDDDSGWDHPRLLWYLV